MKQAGVYNPYWSTLGGGEKYTATVIEALLRSGYAVSIYCTDQKLAQKIYDRFSIDIHDATISKSSPSKLDQLKLDLLFWVSDGSIPLMLSKKNVLHFQVPFHDVKGNQLANQLKLKTVHKILCNSQFTKSIIDNEFGCSSDVVYPPCTPYSSTQKTHTILSVGRFDNHLHAKRQDVLIEAFKQLNLPDWQLVLAGGSLDGSDQINKLRAQAESANIKLVINPTYNELAAQYGQAALYWHAAGFGSDLVNHPEQGEHFGISTVEAMSAGAIPIVFDGGGQKEIIQTGASGYTWKTIDELVNLTKKVITDSKKRDTIGQSAIQIAKKFSSESFIYAFKQAIS